MAAPIVLVTSRSFSSGDFDANGALAAAGAELVHGPSDHELSVLRPALDEASAWIAGTGPITSSHLAAAHQLRLIARYGVGVDAVDLSAAARSHIMVTNTPGANSGAVADHAVALMLAALRQVTLGDRRVRTGDFRVERTRQLGGLTVGIVGVGRIGREVAVRLTGFGCALVGYDRWVPPAELQAVGIEPVTMEQLAERSDVVTLHAPGEGSVIDAFWLQQAKPGVILVNTARASLVDERAVAAALADHIVRVYAADTLSTEATNAQNPLLDETLSAQTIFTPHWAAQTVEAVDNMGRGAVDAVLAMMRGDQPLNLVAAPCLEEIR